MDFRLDPLRGGSARHRTAVVTISSATGKVFTIDDVWLIDAGVEANVEKAFRRLVKLQHALPCDNQPKSAAKRKIPPTDQLPVRQCRALHRYPKP